MTLTIKYLISGYTKTSVINGLSVRAQAGDFIGLVGPNGAGKSCLLKTIAGIIKPDAGSISLDGKNIENLSSKTRAKQIAYLAQDRGAAWALSVRDLVALGRAPYRGPLGKLSADGEAAIDAALKAAQCEDLQGRCFDSLSGGEQARVYLARALAVDAPVLLADEPTAALDPYYQLSIMQTLRAQTAQGKTVIASLHDLALAKQFCSRIWVMDGGTLAEDAAADKALGADILKQIFRVQSKLGVMTLS